MAAIYRAKNADYGNSYELAAELLRRPVVEVLLSRMTDKLARACRLAQGKAPQVEGEALEDTLLDLGNYAVLGVLALKRDKEKERFGCGCTCGENEGRGERCTFQCAQAHQEAPL